MGGRRDAGGVLEEPGGVPADTRTQEQTPEQSHAIDDVPGLLADRLQGTQDTAVHEALRSGRTIRRGQGYSVRVAAPLALHQAALKQCAALAGDGSTPAGRKAYRTDAGRIAAAAKSLTGARSSAALALAYAPAK
ncbi:hypothetical protein [Streptomyces bobili]|uniref:hypothetical protein n=1 Tax=Streptomyces bobili TaxID=67280 RepID=UPI0037243DF5